MIIPTGKSFAREFSEKVGAGLQALATMKMQEMARQRKAQELEGLAQNYGLPKEFGLLSPQAQSDLLRNSLATNQNQFSQQEPSWQNSLSMLARGLYDQFGPKRQSVLPEQEIEAPEKTEPFQAYTSSPTYQSQILKNMERRLSRIIGNNKSLAADIAESAYDTFNQGVQAGVPVAQAVQQAIAAARNLKKDLLKKKRKPKAVDFKKPVKASLKPKKLTIKVVDKFLEQANFDANKARELARAEGYKV